MLGYFFMNFYKILSTILGILGILKLEGSPLLVLPDTSAKIIFTDDFIDNRNQWDLFTSGNSKIEIKNGILSLKSFQSRGICRYKNIDFDKSNFIAEVDFTQHIYGSSLTGMVFGLKDWNNYWFFVFGQGTIFIGEVSHGNLSMKAKGRFSASLFKSPKEVKMKLSSSNSEMQFLINNEAQMVINDVFLPGSGIGPIVSGKGKIIVDKFVVKQNPPGKNTPIIVRNNVETKKWKSSGTGFFIHQNGYLATNYHVIEGMDNISISINQDGTTKKYPAKVVVTDANNDLAILRIIDTLYRTPGKIPYRLGSAKQINTGASVFSIGYPMFDILGSEAKFSDGKISSKTGYKNSVTTFQTTVAVQPGNSGSPLFNENGEVVGIVNAIIKDADNVSYAIKAFFLFNLIDLVVVSTPLLFEPQAQGEHLENMIKKVSPYIVHIEVE